MSRPVELELAKTHIEVGVMEAVRSYFEVQEPVLMRHEMTYVVFTTFAGDSNGKWIYAKDSSTITMLDLHSMLPGTHQYRYIEQGRQVGHSMMTLLIQSAVFEQQIQKWWVYRLCMRINRVLQKIIDFRLALDGFTWYYWMQRHSSLIERIDHGPDSSNP